MSSGLPINSFSQAAEYRKRYLATLALTAQNDAYNLQANQVYRQTGQPSRPPDTRTTTEKLADIEKLKVELRNDLLAITDGEMAGEAVENMTIDEIVFASQQLQEIVADLKPKFRKGVPSQALLAYIRALRRKSLQTNGVSFEAQEATAQQILNAVEAGVSRMGANGGPFSMDSSTSSPVPIISPAYPTPPPPASPEIPYYEEAPPEIPQTPQAPETPQEAPSFTPATPLTKAESESILRQFKADKAMKQGASEFGPYSAEEWDSYPQPGGFAPYPDLEAISVQFLKWWADAQPIDVKRAFSDSYERKRKLDGLKRVLTPGVIYKLEQMAAKPANVISPEATQEELFPWSVPEEPLRAEEITRKIGDSSFSQRELVKEVTRFLEANRQIDNLADDTGRQITPEDINLTGKTYGKLEVYETNLLDLLRDVDFSGSGVGFREQTYPPRRGLPKPREDPQKPPSKYRILPYPTMNENVVVGRGYPIRRAFEPVSRYPAGRQILGYGLKLPPQKIHKKPIQIDMTKGLSYESAPSYIPFGKYIVNPSKLSSGVFEMKTLKGGNVVKYPAKKLSPSLTKVMNRIVGGRMPDEYDFNEMDLEDQHFLFDLSKDAKISDRLHLPTPKRTKDGEEENRFEILKGEIMAGNDGTDVVKEFKKLLLKFSNDGRIKKTEAREILLDLTSMGH